MATTGTTKARGGPKTIQGKVRTMTDPAQQKTMQEYESALKAMQEGKYEKAREGFRKLSEQGSPEVAERARVYFEACGRQAATARGPSPSPRSGSTFSASSPASSWDSRSGSIDRDDL